MKKYFVYVILTISLIANIAMMKRYNVIDSVYKSFTNKPVAIPETYTIYDIQTSMYEKSDYSNIDILFLGDSITDNCDYNNYYDNYKVVNQGINNDTTIGLYNRLDYAIKCKPKKICIAIGINDIVYYHQETETIIDNYNKIVSKLSAELPNSEIYIESIYPLSNELIKYDKNICVVNSAIKDLSDNNKIFFIDVYSELKNKSNIYISDGLHLNGNGYAELIKILNNNIFSTGE